ncbi:hypothetical protein PSWA111526_12720 [Pseudomonas wadenswilerensis]
MLGIGRYRARGTKTVELDALGLGHGGHRTLQGLWIEVLAHFHQGMQGGVEDLQAVVGNRVVLMNGELAETCARRQALGQLELEVLEPGTTDRTAKTHDGRLADADAVGKVGHGAMHDGRRIKQHVIGNLEFRFA